MHRLAVLHHDVVCYVNYIVDGAHAHGRDTFSHPLRRGLDLDVAHHARGVARAELGVLDVHFHELVDVAAAAPDHGLMELERLLEGDGGLAGQADDGEAVGAVGGYLELHHVVVAADDGDYVVTGFAVLLQDEEAVLNGVGEVVQREAELLERAHHALAERVVEGGGADGNAAGQGRAVERHGDEVADLLVLSAGDDLQQPAAAHIDLAVPESVLAAVPGVPEQVHLHYPADNNAAYALAHVVRALDLGAGHGHGLGELVVVLLFKAHIDELAEPLS